FKRTHPDVTLRVIDNPERTVPHALNRAISAAHGDVILRMDGHAVPMADYVSACVAALDRSGAANAGGAFVVRGNTPFGHAVALATQHRLGAGDARYRAGGTAGDVDTVPFGTFRRETFERVGLFDESLVRNQDYEMNYRIRRAGLRIFFDPEIRVTYVPRGTVRALASQYLQYGWWKVETVRRHPASLRLRQAIPPLFLAWFVGWALAAPWSPVASVVLAASFAVYAVTILMISLRLARPPARALDIAVAFATIHFSWATGFVMNLVTAGRFPYRSKPPRIPRLKEQQGPSEVM
ncbi:MAG: glycosyltransferase family 2 protein, partial [Thioalkalivibrio sp.]|nr:glycosyltransferase family 2 protein [Thioalkalivibrio sp.]